MYLVDTNVWLERLLEQEKYEEVKRFLDSTPSDRLFITDFALHSIGIVLIRLKREKALLQFVQDAFVDGAVSLVHLLPGDLPDLLKVVSSFRMDFDDAYQYVAASKYNLVLISFDSDFDHTPLGKKTPSEVFDS